MSCTGLKGLMMKFSMGLASRTIRVLQAGEMPEDAPGHGESVGPKGT
jgi:hypothetical protein